MQRTSAFVSIIMGVALAASLVPEQAGAGQKKGDPKLEDAVTFKVRVRPHDPFDPRNETGAVDKWKAASLVLAALHLPGPIDQLDADGNWKVHKGEIARIEVLGTLKDGWNTYPITQRTSEQRIEQLTTWTIEPGKGFTALWPIFESSPKKATEPALGTLYKYVEPFVWAQDVLIARDAPGKLTVKVKLHIQLCASSCYWFDHDIPVALEVSDKPAEPESAEVAARLKMEKPPIRVEPTDPGRGNGDAPGPKAALGQRSSIIPEGLVRDSHDVFKRKLERITAQISAGNNAVGQTGDHDLLGFLLTGMFWGGISLITPCVFPMIPITVSFFLKQSEKEHHRPVFMAGIYCLTIIVVLTLAAALLLKFFQELSVHPVTNYFIGGLFAFFALSLFGMYEIELPQSLAQFTSSREGKGGIQGTIFMALTFTIISFACVAPFLGGFGGTAAAERPLLHNILGGLAFSVTFASPFFVLALFPTLVRQLPKSGSWLNVVKVVMGFLEFAAAFKFFRQAELAHSAGLPSFFTFDLVLALWIAMSVLCGLYLLGFFRLPHDTPEENITVPRLLFSMAFLGLGLYLAPALFKIDAEGAPQRPTGTVYAWIDAFLLPDSHAGGSEIPNTGNLDWAIEQSRVEYRKSGKPKRIFIDFTGVTCSNCKINEKSVFTKPEISKLFAPYLFVKLYTDTVPAAYYVSSEYTDDRSAKDGKANLDFRGAAFDSRQLPLYVILEPQLNDTIRVLGVYKEARINNEAEFAAFLREPDAKK